MVKPSGEDKPIKKSADEIQVVYQNDLPIFYSYTVIYAGSRRNIFIELIANGKNMGLYKGKDEVLGRLFIVRKSEQLTALNKNELRANYSFLYSDCEEFQLEDKYAYTEKSILMEFENYNQCLGQEISVENNPQKRMKPAYYVGPKIGYNYGNFILTEDSYLDRGSYSAFSSLRLGAMTRVQLSKRFNVQLDVSHYTKKSSSDSVNTWPAIHPEVYSTVEFDLNLLDFQLIASYEFLQAKKFALNAGIGTSFGLLLEANYYQEESDPIGRGVGPASMDFSDTNDWGVVMQLGFSYIFQNSNRLDFAGRFIMTDLNPFIKYGPEDELRFGYYALNSMMYEVSLFYLFKLK